MDAYRIPHDVYVRTPLVFLVPGSNAQCSHSLLCPYLYFNVIWHPIRYAPPQSSRLFVSQLSGMPFGWVLHRPPQMGTGPDWDNTVSWPLPPRLVTRPRRITTCFFSHSAPVIANNARWMLRCLSIIHDLASDPNA